MKKLFCSFVLLSVAAGFSVYGSGSRQTETAGPKVVSFWYNNTGDEAKVYEQAIAAYNAAQNTYKVEGLSVNDQQKLIVAMSGNEAPDLVQGSNAQIVSYQANGLLTSLKAFIDRDKFDLSIYSQKSIEANTIKQEIYALPLTGYTIQMFYNKDLLKAAGFSEPPKTVEELYDMAVAATKLDAAGNIEVLGYPLFPLASARQELIYAFGGRWWSADGQTLTPQDKGIIESLTYNVRYRNLYGIEKVQAFVATANTNRYTEKDMFFAGKQLFRFDGSWLPTMMKNFNSTVNYGITLIPGTKARPELIGTSRFETNSLFIPITATQKEGAWDFAKWLTGPTGAKIIDLGTGNLPALKALYTDKDILAKPGFPEFIEALKLEKGIQYAQINDFNEYISMLNEYLDYVYSGQQSPEAAMAALADRAKNLK
ncbi:MAG: ABC transporter substrate-binding protein [Spirochaetaceae bacterium]|jgi:multiple sugar transport system substrate-binding protein|nr:ABC transporter substrate-binding protein [Spirochaetaceae bacterium]